MTDAGGSTGIPYESEWIECAALQALHASVDEATGNSLGISLRHLGGGACSVAAALPSSAIVMNRAMGFGLSEPIEPSAITKVAEIYRVAGVQRYFLQIHPNFLTESVSQACRDAGFSPARAWQKFTRLQGAPLPKTAGLDIREIRAEDVGRYGPAFARIVCAAFDLGEAAEPWLMRLPNSEGWRTFVALIDGRPIGTGGLFIRSEIAWIDWDATEPEFRCLGVQSALLAYRLRLADQLGCHRAHTCTGEAVPGDPQHSYSNIVRCGFNETYVRPNFAPQRVPASLAPSESGLPDAARR